jgi:hypothetical protein
VTGRSSMTPLYIIFGVIGWTSAAVVLVWYAIAGTRSPVGRVEQDGKGVRDVHERVG